MDQLSAPSWYQLALQIPLALVIVFLVIRFLGFVKEMMQSFLQALKEQDANNRDFIREQQEINREFIEKQQEHTNSSLGRLAEEIKNNKTDTLKELSNLTQRVDGVLDKAIIMEHLISNPKSARK